MKIGGEIRISGDVARVDGDCGSLQILQRSDPGGGGRGDVSPKLEVGLKAR